jgi:hypothetical protein
MTPHLAAVYRDIFQNISLIDRCVYEMWQLCGKTGASDSDSAIFGMADWLP